MLSQLHTTLRCSTDAVTDASTGGKRWDCLTKRLSDKKCAIKRLTNEGMKAGYFTSVERRNYEIFNIFYTNRTKYFPLPAFNNDAFT